MAGVVVVTAAPASAAGWTAAGFSTPSDVSLGSTTAAFAGSGISEVIAAQGTTLRAWGRPFGGSFAEGAMPPASATLHDSVGLSDGSTIVVWIDGNTARAARRAPGATTFTAMPDIGAAGSVVLARSPDGSRAMVALASPGTAGAPVKIALVAAGDTSFGSLHTINSDMPVGGHSMLSDAAVSNDGAAAVCYAEYAQSLLLTGSGAAECRHRSAAGVVEAAQELGDLQSQSTSDCGTTTSLAVTRLSFDPAGDLHVVYAVSGSTSVLTLGVPPTCEFSSSEYHVRHLRRTTSGWTTPLALADGSRTGNEGHAFDGLDAELDGTRTVVVTRTSHAGGTSYLREITVAPGGATSSARPDPVYQGSSAAAPGLPVLEAAAGGDVVLVFTHGDSISSSVRPSGGSSSFSAPATRAVHAGLLVTGADLQREAGGGDVLASWLVGSPSVDQRAQTAAYDATAPTLSSVTVPSAGTAGQSVTMGVVATADNWSPSTISWDFGDNSADATGTSVQHTYAAAGTYTVTVSVADGLGNTTTTIRQIAIGTPLPSSASTTSTSAGPSPGNTTSDAFAPTLLPTTSTAAAADRRAPVLSGLAISPTKFRLAAGPTALAAARVARGATITVGVSEPAIVVLKIKRVLTGVLRKGRCRFGAFLRPGERRCTERKDVGHLQRRAAATTLAVPFTGRLGTQVLAAGRYEMTATATDAAGNVSAARTAGFRIVTG